MTAPTEANMTTLQEALPCPFCGKQHTLQVISGQELMDENQEFWQHSESFGVVCDASTPDGKGGCGAMGGFKPTEEEAIEAWDRRTALAQQATLVPQEWTNLLAYALQDDMHNRLTPRVVDIAYTAFTLAKRPNSEDGGASDWFNDTKPKVTELIAKLRKDLIEEFAAAPAPQQDESAQVQYLKSELAHALAQHREQQPVCHGCGIPAGDVHMSTCKSGKWPSRVSNGDTAAPAPQPSQGGPTGCACRWDADDNRVATCARHQGWLDVVYEWAERAKAAEAALQSAQPKQEPLRELTEPQVHGIAHRKATRYTYIAKPSEVMYGFSETHIVDFVRAIEKAMG